MKLLKSHLLLFAFLSAVVGIQSCKKDSNSCPAMECNTGVQNAESCDCVCPEGYSGTNCEIKDLCIGITCDRGNCVDGNCDCPAGYTGTKCELFDITQVQALLENHTPKELVDAGIPIDSLFGKRYKDGLIFYFNIDDGTGMVAATQDQTGLLDGVEWGCYNEEIKDLKNVFTDPTNPETLEGTRIGDGEKNTDLILDPLTGCMISGIAARLCRNLGEEWFLPSRAELNLMWTNLADPDGDQINEGVDDRNNLGGFSTDRYWSSTQYSSEAAWIQEFDFGMQTPYPKDRDTGHAVRAVRAF